MIAKHRTAARTLMGGGGGYIRIFMFCMTSFFSNQIQIDQFEFDLKETRPAEHEYVNKHRPPPINVLARDATRVNQTSGICYQTSLTHEMLAHYLIPTTETSLSYQKQHSTDQSTIQEILSKHLHTFCLPKV